MTSTKPNKITVLLDSAEFARFDAYCASRGFKKSTLIARLIREHLDAAQFQTQHSLPLGGSGSDKTDGSR